MTDANDAKEYLQMRHEYINDIANLENELEAVCVIQENPKVQLLSDMPKAQGKNTDISSQMVIREKLEQDIQSLRLEYSVYKYRVDYVLQLLTTDERDLLTMRYEQMMTPKQIEISFGCYSDRTLRNIHKRALSNFCAVYNDVFSK